ncbi:hypothetical protein EI42_03799 [Thermosporothrix hazakensis]|jgi:transcriptional regulator with XRE-family HTH domain|uniref:HTH cro/C1-type domain-containing protein n=2 Tax=Thermosporothrix TaxID=768650 RepID=A0A326U4J1_THEHA|nr:helix-turn-helix transcriptional regulator [Thermosporothrix hazakensis]PZW26647.1 hypothetical protein EI42_03799 [Thermosporothrix hazakensis]BBH89467.1 hypothetical protein KTC_42180 [Thermosporothrix sp. COM3]GCE47651.1 hypothetical protein KTH_25200 [Thermosporothrix hazakensis]
MTKTDYYWWHTYGPFDPGEGQFPHIGQVIKHYRKLRGWEQEELARILGWSLRYIKMLESPKNKKMPELIPRRVRISRALNIPPVLLGLSTIALLEQQPEPLTEVITGDLMADEKIITFYENLLALSWDFYYSSSVQRAACTIDLCFSSLRRRVESARGVCKDQFEALLCRFYQLYSLLERDRLHIDEALAYENQAIEIAFHLRNTELIAASLLRRARIYIQSRQFEPAYQDAMQALPYADLSRDPLKGKVYQIAGEAQAYLAGKSERLQERSLTYFNTAGHIVRKGRLEPDGSFVRLDITSLYIERAKALTLFGRYDEAAHALLVARKGLKPGLPRWQINLLLEEARVHYALQQYSDCALFLLRALKIVRALDLPMKEERIRSTFLQCKEQAPNEPHVFALEQALTQKK